jgi:carbamoyl-phosphate synthase large subunit
LKHIIEREGIQFLHSQPEAEIYQIGKHREEILETGCLLFMPPQDTIEKLRNKWTSYTIWRDAGIKVPEGVMLNTTPDLMRAFEKFKREIWIRETVGAAGKGSLSRPTYQTALDQIDTRRGWGKTMAAEHLTKDTITWMSIWFEGDLVVGQGRRRLYWAFDNRAQSGVTGLTGTGVTVKDDYLDRLAIKCILAADLTPHGIYSVDFTFDWEGFPNPTEINIGKFFTTHHFITSAGCNMPEILVKLAFGEYDAPFGLLNPAIRNLYWIRGIDTLPKLVNGATIHNVEKQYAKNLKEIR